MSAPHYNTLVTDFMNQMDGMMHSFLSDNFQALAVKMAAPIAALSTLYIVVQGYLINAGVARVNTNTFLKMAFTIGFINLFALNWLYFNDYFVGLFLGCAEYISSMGSQGLGNSSINEALQTVLTESVHTGVEIMQQGSYRNWMPLFIGFGFIVGGTLVVSLAMIELSMIKFCLSFLLSLGPLFVAFCFFEQSKKWYHSWMGVLAGFSFALIFSGMSLRMAMKFMHWVVGSTSGGASFELEIYTLVPLALVVLISLFLMFLVIPIAKQIGGAASGAHAGDALRAGSSMAKKAAQGVRGLKQHYAQRQPK